MRLIATEEAFAPIEYIERFLELTKSIDTPVSRYLSIYYQRAEAVRQLTDLDYRIADMDAHGVDMHLLSLTGPGTQAFDAGLGTELATIANNTLARAIAKYPTRYAGLGAIARASVSLAIVASSVPRPASNACVPGPVRLSRCMSTPCASMSAMR